MCEQCANYEQKDQADAPPDRPRGGTGVARLWYLPIVALAAVAGAVLTVGLTLLALLMVGYIRIRLSAPNQPSPVSRPLVAALIVLGACGGGVLWTRLADFATGHRWSVYRGLLPRIILLAGVASWQWFAYSIGLGGALALILCVGALDGLVLYLQRRLL